MNILNFFQLRKDLQLAAPTLLLLTLVALLALNAACAPASSGSEPASSETEPAPIRGKSGSKLSTRLQRLTEASLLQEDEETQAQELGLPASGPGSLMRNENGDVLVVIRLADTSEATLAEVETLVASMENVAEEFNTVTAYINPAQLAALAALESVESIQEELSP